MWGRTCYDIIRRGKADLMQRSWGRASVISLTGALMAALGASPARAVDDLTLAVAPGSQTVLPGGTVTVRLDVANLSQAINGVQVLLRYDPARLTLLDIVPTDLGLAPPNAGWVEVFRGDVAGDLTYAASINGGQALIGHTIATLTFRAIGEGVTNITFRADAPPFITKLTIASDNSIVLPNKVNSGSITLTCDDGLFCNGAETFDGLNCQPGFDPCDDFVNCTDDSCVETTDTCVHAPNDPFCSDGLFCNGSEFCDALLDCQPGPDPCDDGIGCTDDFCAESTDTCTNAENDFNCPDDGAFCNGIEFCDAVADCSSTGDPCLATQFCNETTNTCDQCAVDANCNDGVPCTDDRCVAGACTVVVNDANCTDLLFCNGAETCDVLLDCQPGFDPCEDNVPCTIDACDELADSCSHTPDNAVCDDGLFCNGAETCDALLGCQPSTDPCAPLFCDEAGDRCLAPLQITNLEVYYAGQFANAADTGKQFLAVGSTATLANVTNHWRGITGIRVFFNQSVVFQTTPAAAFSLDWTTSTGTTFSAVTDVATAVTVTAADQAGATVVSIVLTNNHVRNRWLKVRIDAAQVTSGGVAMDGELAGSPIALPSGDGNVGGDAVFFLGNVSGDVNGDRKTTLTDVGLIRVAVNPFLAVPITNALDIDKDGKVVLTDVGRARLDVNPFFTLPLIAP